MIRPRETVLMADDFGAMIDWYCNVLGFAVTRRVEDDYHYCNLETPSGIQIGIADATEMKIDTSGRANNTVVLQFEVDDAKVFFEHLQGHGAKVTFGPSFDKAHNFWFGGVEDCEGNPIWVVDRNCP